MGDLRVVGRWPSLGDDVHLAPRGIHTGSAQFALAQPTIILPSGVNLIDGMLSGLIWDSTALTFSFPTDPSFYEGSGGYLDGDEQDQNFEALNAQQQQAVISLFAMISTVSNLTFTQITESETEHADLRFGMSDAAEVAYAYLPDPTGAGGDAWFNSTSGNFDAPVLGDYAYMGFLHEMGHALGLDHPFDENVYGAIPLDWDSTEFTVMTYRSALGSGLEGYTNGDFSFPQSLMMLDIAALQYMYGANFNYNATDTTYTFSETTGEMFINGVGQGVPGGNVVFRTIWDGGGLDTYNFSNYIADLFIDLGPGYSSVLAPEQLAVLDPFNEINAIGSVFNALLYQGDTRSLIENAVGGDGNDIFFGNDANNTLTGGYGSDYFVADLGADTYIGGTLPANDAAGRDLVSYEFSTTAVTINTRTGVNVGAIAVGDTYQMIDGFVGSVYNDTLVAYGYIFGYAGNDSLTGYNFEDVLDGGDGDDVLFSSAGEDDFIGGAGRDTVSYANLTTSVFLDLSSGFNGNGEEYGDRFSGIEVWVGTSYGDQMIGNNSANTLDGGAGNDTLQGGGGDDILLPGSGANTLDGGSGMDIVSYANIFTFGGIGIELRVTPFAAKFGEISDDTFTSIEGIIGTSADDRLEMDNNANYIDGGAGNDVLNGFGGIDTIYGGAGVDNINSGTEADFVYGGDGDDLINGWAGNDTIYGDAGNDRIDGSTGVDQMYGGAGNDTYLVDDASDGVTELANDGADVVQASVNYTLAANIESLTLTGANAINGTGNTGANALTGNSAANVLDGGFGADVMAGGLGDDTYYVDNGGDLVTESADEGTDTVRSQLASITLGANVENLILEAGAANGTGNELNNTITGNSAANILDGGLGADTMNGGEGDDTYIVDNAADVVTEDAGQGTDTVRTAMSFTLGANFEGLVLLGAAVVNATGNALNNTLTGNIGANILDGGAGADTMIGGDGDDIYIVDHIGDVVTEASALGGIDMIQSSLTRTLGANFEQLMLTGFASISGYGNALNNLLIGNGVDNLLYGFDGNDILNGASGADQMFGGNGDDAYYVDNVGDLTTEASALGGVDIVYSSISRALTANIENLTLTNSDGIIGYGNVLSNVITGNSGANTLYGVDGNDRLDGNTGADTMFGAAGDDVYVVDDVNDITVEGLAGAAGGVDTVETFISRNLNANFENMILLGSATIAYGNVLDNVLTGNALGNSLYGFDGNDTLDGGLGADQMFGANGNDTYIVDNSGDVTAEASALGGVDTVIASVSRNLTANLENLTLTGWDDLTGAGNGLGNVIVGNNGANTLYGLDGSDRLDGGWGMDTLQGGAGADEYVFSTAPMSGNVDTIVGFNVADDTVVLGSAVFSGLGVGALAASAFAVGAAAAEADDRIIYNSSTGQLYFDADGNDAGVAVLFAMIAPGLALTSADFIIGGP